MTDTPTPQAELPQLQINGQYIKDLSFEVPAAPQVFMEQKNENPEIPIHVDVNATNLGPNLFEVVLHMRIEAKLPSKPLFILELDYAGLFTVNFPEEQMHPVLMIECPRLLFPFARNIVADMTRDGGFPPLMLQPLDFVALYRSRLEEISAQQPVGNA
ncbi:protein-export chaperone SecB [Paramagnetospirillum marisnigri]|uniref:Protein-export protein SecB n=1 Tax=Paramagnetospirillum marisnigri TaxID=1285242 RepID=A0A178MP23_9PROT|nr:protein-export chaperone SecB [Paramagnetospirillum marisnigri]OAN50341.1 protein-export chaperone SecB [Paramagnetospirillum marisnigri]